MLDLVGKYVEVVANGIVYRGKLVEIGEEDVYIEGESGWVAIPVERVITVREQER